MSIFHNSPSEIIVFTYFYQKFGSHIWTLCVPVKVKIVYQKATTYRAGFTEDVDLRGVMELMVEHIGFEPMTLTLPV